MQTRGVLAYLLRMLEAEGGKASTLSVMQFVSILLLASDYVSDGVVSLLLVVW